MMQAHSHFETQLSWLVWGFFLAAFQQPCFLSQSHRKVVPPPSVPPVMPGCSVCSILGWALVFCKFLLSWRLHSKGIIIIIKLFNLGAPSLLNTKLPGCHSKERYKYLWTSSFLEQIFYSYLSHFASGVILS